MPETVLASVLCRSRSCCGRCCCRLLALELAEGVVIYPPRAAVTVVSAAAGEPGGAAALGEVSDPPSYAECRRPAAHALALSIWKTKAERNI